MVAKNVLFIGGPAESVPAFGQAKAAGFNVFVTDGDPVAPGILWAKRHGAGWAVAPSTYDFDQTLECAKRFRRIDGVLAVGCDVGPVVSFVAQGLDLPHVPVRTALLSWDKHQLKAVLADGGVRTPAGWASNVHVPRPFDGWQIVKPYRGRGGRGVSLASTEEGIAAAFEEAQTESPNGMVLVEQFVKGPQLSVEVIVWDGEVVFCGMTDRDYRFAETWPNPVEFGGWGPTEFTGTVVEVAVKETVEKAIKALSIKSGTVKFDVVLDLERDLEPVIIEVAIGRVSGGFTATHYWPLCYNTNFIPAVCSVAYSENPDYFLGKRFYGWSPDDLYCRGLYQDAARACHNKERGRFHLAVGRSRIEATNKAARWKK